MSIVEMSVQAGMLIIAVVIVRAIALYRLPKTSFLALWGIVVARMLIPFGDVEMERLQPFCRRSEPCGRECSH